MALAPVAVAATMRAAVAAMGQRHPIRVAMAAGYDSGPFWPAATKAAVAHARSGRRNPVLKTNPV